MSVVAPHQRVGAGPTAGLGWLCWSRVLAARHVLASWSEQSRLKLVVVGLFAVLVPLGLHLLFLSGFRFLTTLGGVGLIMVRPFFSLFFLSLGVLMMLSAIVTAFPAVFRSAETEWLRTTPLDPRQIALYKWLETAWLSAWAYFFIVLPFAAAYGRHEGYPIRFPLAVLLFSVPFVLLCAGLGWLLSVALARWVPSPRVWRLLPSLVLVGLTVAVLRAKPALDEIGTDVGLFLRRLAPGLRLSSHPLWPSAWLAEGILAVAQGAWRRALWWGTLLVSNAAMVGLLVEQAGRRLLPEAWLRISEVVAAPRPRPATAPRRARGIESLPGPRAFGDLIAIAIKDLRLFVRDPVQWSQGLFFFVLLALYFLNLRTFRYDQLEGLWRDIIAFLNVFSISAVACSFSSRFLYPQLSLEGHAIWILGLAPGGLARAYRVKWAVSMIVMALIGGGLAALSAHMLRVDAFTWGVVVLTAIGLSAASAGLSISLGTVFLDTRERNPSAIVSGFGGTLNLVLNLTLTLVVTLPLGALFHLRHRWMWPDDLFRDRLMAATLLMVGAVGLALGAAHCWALRSLEEREF